MPKNAQTQKLKLPLFIVCFFSPLLLAECVKFCLPSPAVVLHSLRLPIFMPPMWLAVCIWFLLYLMMGYSLYIILTNNILKGRPRYSVFLYFVLQLALNYLWLVVFFVLQYRGLSVLMVAFLLALVIAVWKRLRAINTLMSHLWFFYTAWLFFSAVLNYTIWILNL